MLGIIIGVASVIAMLAIRPGIQTKHPGTNLQPGDKPPDDSFHRASTTGGVRLEAGSSVRLNIDDYNAVATRCPAVIVFYANRTYRRSADRNRPELAHKHLGGLSGLFFDPQPED